MPVGNQNDDGSTFAGGERLTTEQMLDETQRVLDNTRAFLESMRDGDGAARLYLKELQEKLENDLRRLERRSRDGGSPHKPEPE